MIPKSIDAITLNDFEALVANERLEDKTIEYKRKLPGKDENKEAFTELLNGLCALANASGGDMLIGVNASKGKPISVDGFTCTDMDALKRDLENKLASKIEPRLPGIQLRELQVSDEMFVLILRVPKSWLAPHRIRGFGRFYGRNSQGKYELEVTELRTAFNLSANLADRLREFRANRLIKIAARETPVPLVGDGAAVVLHMLPVLSYGDDRYLDIANLIRNGTHQALPITGQGGNRSLVNFDGQCLYLQGGGEATESYAQFFRDGALESAMAISTDAEGPNLFSDGFARKMAWIIEQHTNTLRAYGASFPIFAMISFVNCKGLRLKFPTETGFSSYSSRKSHEDVLAFPEIAIEDLDTPVKKRMRPIFNMIWNTFGLDECPLYNGNGEWREFA